MRVGSSASLSSGGFDVSCTTGSQVDDAVAKKLRTYGKFFSSRLIQIVVQSRTSESFDLPCTLPGSSSDWFNVRIDELGEVTAQLKKSLTRFPPEVSAFSIDFFLYTADGDTLPLETWSFSVDEDRRIPEDNTSMLYHELGVLLRSAMAAARMTPMHRYYVKKQGPDTFVILYRLVEGPSSLDLGNEKKTVRLGSFPSQLGTMSLELNYRTRMEIERRPVAISPVSESFQQLRLVTPGTTPDNNPPVLGSPGTPGSFCEVISNFSTSPASVFATSPPYSYATSPLAIGTSPVHIWVKQARSRNHSAQSVTSAGSPSDGEREREKERDAKEKEKKLQQSQIIPKDMPFANLLNMSFSGSLHPLPLRSVKEDEDNEDEENEENEESDETIAGDDALPFAMDTSAAASTVVASACATVKNSHHSAQDDFEDDEEADADDSFVKIPLFGAGTSPSGGGSTVDMELGDFISAFRTAPLLSSFEENREDFGRIKGEIATFEKSQCVFDEFVAEIRERHDNIM